MKITPKVLSIPPYLSTTWDNISSLHARAEKGSFTLIVLLQNNVQVEVPGLEQKEIDQIFDAHARSAQNAKTANPLEGPFSLSLPLRADGPLSTLGPSMQHNPEQAELDPLPPEVLNKITMIAKAFGLEDSSALQPPEPNCSCIYCQVVRSLQGYDAPVEEVKDEDLKFRDWEIKQTGDKLYTVTNPLDANEYYHVFLGSPIGCTCGSKNCEHIQTVLKS